MSRKHKPNWETLAKMLLRQAGVKPPHSFWDLLHLIQQNLPKESSTVVTHVFLCESNDNR